MSLLDIKLIAIDLDGTLLDDNKRISSQTIDTLCKIRQLGIYVTLASGRPFCSVMPYARKLQLELPIIAHNGAYISDVAGKNIYLNKTLDKTKSKEVIKILEEHNYYIKVYCGNMLFVQETTEETISFSRSYGVPYKAVGRYQLATLTEQINKIVIIDRPERINNAWNLIKPWNSEFAFSRDSERGLEIMDHSVNKGNALRIICKRLGIRMNNVMAIGNEGNDLEMIKDAGLGIAMGNAYDELKLYAADTTKSNNDSGVDYVLKKYILEKCANRISNPRDSGGRVL